MRAAAEHELAVVARGAGGRLGWGVPPTRCDLLIDLSRMSRWSSTRPATWWRGCRPERGWVTSRRCWRGTGRRSRSTCRTQATVGGVVASGLAGPRRLRYGTPRDLLIGITIVRADGTVARSGGKVVKNVAGYDLGKLLAGSAGTLALITEATFRLHPLPAARVYVTARVRVRPDRVRRGRGGGELAADRLGGGAGSAAPGGPIRIGVLLEGSAEGVAARAMRMAGLLGPAETSARAAAWWRGAPRPTGGTLIRVSCWVSALPKVLDAVEAAALDAGVSPTSRARPARACSTSGRSRRGAGTVRRVGAGAAGGALRRAGRGGRAAAPAAVREALAGYGGMAGTVPSLALMRAVKDQFDPGHRMAPGRFPDVM